MLVLFVFHCMTVSVTAFTSVVPVSERFSLPVLHFFCYNFPTSYLLSVPFQLLDTVLCKNLVTTFSRSISFCLNVSLIWIQAKNFKMKFEILSVAGCYRASDFQAEFLQQFSPSYRFSECHFKDAAFSFHLYFCPDFVLLWFNCCNILLSDLCKFNISLLSSRLSSSFKVNFLLCYFSCIILL